MKVVDDFRGDYKRFLNSPIGKDLLARMAEYETALMIQAYAESSHQKKAQSIDKAAGIYWVRTELQNLSSPKTEPLVKGTKRRKS